MRSCSTWHAHPKRTCVCSLSYTQTRLLEQRLTAIREEESRLKAHIFTEVDFANSIRQFDPVWEALSTREKARVFQLLLERVDYEGAEGTVAVTFRPSGIKVLHDDVPTEESRS